MATFRKNALGKPPSIEEASPNLQAPETAPADPPKAHQRIDGRSARRSNRTVQFATRVTPAFDARIREISARDNLLLVEILERALEAYESNKKIVASS
jgi:hypothetical protein